MWQKLDSARYPWEKEAIKVHSVVCGVRNRYPKADPNVHETRPETLQVAQKNQFRPPTCTQVLLQRLREGLLLAEENLL